MKILVVFNSVNDIVFCHADQAYLANLVAAFRGSAEAGEAGVSRETLDILVQLFSPLLTTYNLMRTQQSAYRRVILANNEEIVFRRCEDFLMIGVFSTKTFCPPAKQLANVERQLRSLVGPYFDVLKQHREGAFSLVGSMVSGWKTLFTHELALTFSAVERVKVDGVIKARAIESIERGFQRRRRDLSGVEHVLIVCGTKLLCLYSTERTSKMVAQDFLTLISLVPALFPKFDVYDESRYKEPQEGATFNSCAEPTNSSSNSDVSSAFHSCSEFVLSTPHSPRSSGLAATPERINGAFGASQRQSTSSSGSCIELEHNAHYPLVQQIELNKSSPSESKALLVFLSTMTSTLSPFKVHFVPLTGNVVFLALEAVEPRSVARLVDRIHRAADRALSQVNQPISDLATTQAAISIELHAVRRLLGELIRTLREPPGVAACFAPACERAMSDVSDHLSRAAPGGDAFRTADLYLNAVENLLHKLKTSVMKGIFESLFLQFPSKMTATVCQAVQDLAQGCRKDLQDYLPFLDVKARRNLASSSVLASYVGLVHFALVDRHSDEIVAPTPDWGRHPKGLSKRILATIGALRDAAHALKARERDHTSTGVSASGLDTGAEAARRKEVQLYQRDRSYQYSYLIQWEQSHADPKLLDPGFELATVHSLEANRDVIQRHLVSLIAKYLPSRDSPEMDSGLL